jgi:3-hydroxybutyryl-CoA dehydratase
MSEDKGRLLSAGEYWLEDLAVGDHFLTGGITVTETHIVSYAGLSGDLFDLHMDDDFARAHGFEGRIAHGLLGLSLVDGLKTRSAIRLAAVAALGWNWSFRAPIQAGDRIRARFEVVAKRPTRSGGRGIVTLGVAVRNQRDEIVQEGEHLLMVRCRETA